MKEYWNSRYQQKEFAYGTTPNAFLKETLDNLKLSGNILFPAEGEGRNAVYAAKKGMKVSAFDISDIGKKKALELAQSENVKIDYQIGELDNLNYKKNSFDALVLIYAHFPPNQRKELHQKLVDLVKPNGYIILKGFSKNNFVLRQENPAIGGPRDIDMLFTTRMIKDDFKDFGIIELKEIETELQEGEFHNGLASVIRFIGRKNLDETKSSIH
ncbi:MAG: class I SAM-dependent methyltransferase [Flavobacteriaceae bacterium]